MSLALRHPETGETIGDYTVVELVGAGGLGIVYRVERGGRFFALKVLLVPKLDGRARREIGILIHLEHPCVVRYVGSDFWPDPVIGHPYIVMEYVPGDTLWAFAYKHNPSARKATRIVMDLARTLGEVHAAGVFHRDVKPENIVIRGVSERPVLIDFGIGSLASAPCVTGSALPPGTSEFRSPEQLRFQAENDEGTAHYEFGPSDELWALGVTYYWLLTDVMPFGLRSDPGGVEGLHERILTQRPVAPHIVNPRVPLAASELCMTMLAELPEDRLLVAPLCAALAETLSHAEGDGAWDVPLVDADDPQLATTVEDPARLEPNETRRTFLKRTKQRPRRGRPPPKRAPVLMLAGELPGPRPPPADPDRIDTVAAPPAAAPAGEHKAPDMGPPVPAAREQVEPPVSTHPRRAAWRLGVVVAVLTGAVVVLSVSADLGGSRLSDSISGEQPATFAASDATDGGGIGREVAVDAKPPESRPGGDAAPVKTQSPASTANAMLRTTAQTTKNETTKPQPKSSGFTVPAVVAACSLLDGGCTASTTQIRPEPPAITCPQGWRETHERLKVGYVGYATVKGYKGEPGEMTRVKDGPAALQTGTLGGFDGLPDGTLLLGTWQLGDDRLFGTFNRAQIPGVGTLPVCLVTSLDIDTGFVDERDKEYVCPPGWGVCLAPGSKPGSAKIHTRVRLVRPLRQP